MKRKPAGAHMIVEERFFEDYEIGAARDAWAHDHRGRHRRPRRSDRRFLSPSHGRRVVRDAGFQTAHGARHADLQRRRRHDRQRNQPAIDVLRLRQAAFVARCSSATHFARAPRSRRNATTPSADAWLVVESLAVVNQRGETVPAAEHLYLVERRAAAKPEHVSSRRPDLAQRRALACAFAPASMASR